MKTGIQYADEVSNPLQVRDLETGKKGTHCEKPDPEGTCKGCWAEVLNMRGKPENDRFGTGLTYSKEHRGRLEWFRHEKEMNRLANLNRRKPMSEKFPGNALVVFTNDTYDLFQPSIGDELRDWIFDEYDKFSDLNLLIQSTYVSLMSKYLSERYPKGMPSQYVVGMSSGNQTFYTNNIDHLKRIPALRRYVIFEPLLGPVNMGIPDGARIDKAKFPENFATMSSEAQHRWSSHMARAIFMVQKTLGIHWVIVGGESGSEARPMHPDWAVDLQQQCVFSGISFLFKQWGEYLDLEWAIAKKFTTENDKTYQPYTFIPGSDTAFCRVGKKKAGRSLNGVEWNEFPALPAQRFQI